MTTTKNPVAENSVAENSVANNEVKKPFDAITRDIELREEMSTISRTERELTASLFSLLYDAISTDVEQRSHLREALTAPVSILLSDGYRLSGVTRDISLDGIGLVHAVPIECQEVVVRVFDNNEKPTLLYADIKWCHAIGRGWFVSGGKFIYRISPDFQLPD